MTHPPSLPPRESDGEQGSGLRLHAEMLEDPPIHVAGIPRAGITPSIPRH